MMPCGAAVPLLMLGFLVFGCLLVIRVISRIRPNAPLAAVSMLCVFMLLASNGLYLWYRTNFYSVPIAASLFLSVLGLWLWLGAAKRVPVSGDRIREVDGTQSLSLPHLAAGSMCIAANLGCRPQFILVALLAFVIFWPQIQSIFRHASNDSSLPHMSVWRLMRAPLAALLPALIAIVPLLAYNVVGSDRARLRHLISDDGHGYDQLSAAIVESCADRRILPVPAVAVHGCVSVPRRQSGASSAGIYRGNAWRLIHDSSVDVGRAGLPVPLPAYAQGRAHEHMAVVDIQPGIGIAACGD